VPRVIDFGVAKATQQELTEKTIYTLHNEFIGTPVYMSPEQAEMSGLDIDTRSDIYSLGVLLYELLTGSTPFEEKELLQSGLDAMRKIIREKEPPKPSTRFATLKREEQSTTAARHATDSPRLISLLRGDLDWIVMKGLEKDRTRRYDTAHGLALDVERHLNNEPVLARPPSALYRMQKAWRRNRLVYASASVVGMCVCLALVVSSWSLVREREARVNEVNQRQIATRRAKEAARARERAEAGERSARQRAYASDMNVAKQALDAGNLGRALELLNRQRPEPGQEDLRGWEWRYLWQQTRSDAITVLCQKSEIESLAVSTDGRWLAIGLVHQGGLFIWDLQTQQEVIQLAQGQHEVQAAFSPTEPLLAFTSRADVPSGGRTTLHFWHVGTRKLVGEFPLEGNCAGLTFSQDGRTLATSIAIDPASRGEITVWRVNDGVRLFSLPSQQYELRSATGFAATSDLRLAAYATGYETLHVVDLREEKELWSAVASKVYVTALAFSPDGKTLASAAGFGESDIRLWDVASGAELGRLEGHKGWVGSLVFWPDGKTLASASADQTIRIWDLATRTCTDVLRGHRSEVWRLVLLPDHRTLISGAKDGAVCLWDTSVIHRRRPHLVWSDKIWTWCFAPDGRAILTVDFQGQVARWSGRDFQRKEPLLEVGQMPASLEQPYNLFSPDGSRLACGSAEGTMSVWDVSRPGLWRRFTPARGRVIPCRFLKSGTRLVAWTEADNRLLEWDLETNREVQSWPAPLLPVRGYNGCAWSPVDGQFVAAGFRGRISIRDLVGQSDRTLRLDVLEVAQLAFDPSGKWLAMASYLGYARVWDAQTWQEEATLGGFLNSVRSVAFSGDGTRLITGTGAADEALKVWSTDNWQEVLTLPAEGQLFHGARISRDGHAMGVITALGRLYVWQAPTWDQIEAAERKANRYIRKTVY
jgi:WD40 repeat protein